jgi:hypothetical protein
MHCKKEEIMNPDDEAALRNAITALVFEWYNWAYKQPRGKTLSFWNDEKIMTLFTQALETATVEARLAEAKEILEVAFENLGPEVYFAKDRLEGHVAILQSMVDANKEGKS